MTTQSDVDAIRAALQAKRAGRSVVKVASGGRSIEYDKMTVAELEAQLARAEAELDGRARRGAISVTFG